MVKYGCENPMQNEKIKNRRLKAKLGIVEHKNNASVQLSKATA